MTAFQQALLLIQMNIGNMVEFFFFVSFSSINVDCMLGIRFLVCRLRQEVRFVFLVALRRLIQNG
jgi:hypothetical protein